PLQPAQRSQFAASERVRCWRARLGPTDMQDARFEVNLIPTQVHEFSRPEAVAKGQQDHGRVAMARSRLDQPLDLALGEVLAAAIFGVRPAARCANCRNIRLALPASGATLPWKSPLPDVNCRNKALYRQWSSGSKGFSFEIALIAAAVDPRIVRASYSC